MPLMQNHIVTALFDSFPDPVIVASPAKVIAEANDAACQQFGYAREELLGQPVRFIYASDAEYDLCLNKRSMTADAGSTVESVYAFTRKDQSVFTGRFRSTQVFDDNGNPDGFIGVIHDISASLERDMEHRRVRDILDAALQAVPEGFAVFDQSERLVVFNEAYRKVCGPAGPHIQIGMLAEDILMLGYRGGHYTEARPGDPGAEAWLAGRLEDFRNPTSDMLVFPYGDGRWLRAENLRTDDGNTVVLRIDVTELKQTEIALSRQKLEYVSLVQNLPDLITRISRDKRYTFVNDNYAQFMKLTAEELVGKPFLDFVPAADRRRVSAVLDTLSREEPMVTAEQRRILADGSEFWIFWLNIAIFDGDDLVEFVTVGRDVTKLKQQQARIEHQRVELERKNEALNQFTGTVSHDLKAPLRHISMFSEMIVDDINNKQFGEVAMYAGHLRQSARRMDQLIESLLEYSQIAYEIENLKPVRLFDLVADALVDLDSYIRDTDAKIVIDNMPSLHGDAELLKRLVQNLVGNAIKYRRPGLAPVVRIYGNETDTAVHLYIEDNGIGIDPRFAEKIFDVFQRLHRDETVYAGTGIGLALAKRIVESHNGTISLDTSFSGGARFVIVFPKKLFAGRRKYEL
ncbi:PAS domain S-box protein [Pararhizobium sp.]|uniref:PAS domain S-box protein n=1 Tax=Pararhizobium sp. TaxID=1977563 RepID=UPI00271658C7|nr:PAS domain S-box protein [Pararhizobium sp.]MDO9418864.1 PAS domain S-box protein [Pararhizobium sp.]